MCVPKGNDGELGILCAVFDIVRDDGDIAEVKCCINFVHEVKGSRLKVMESKDKSQGTQSLGRRG